MKNKLLKIWYDIIRRPYFAYKGFNSVKPNEDYCCGECGVPVLERVLFCSNECYFKNMGRQGTIDAINELTLMFFKGDVEKKRLWMRTENPHLGGITPNFMIEIGREEKLLKFIETSKEENGW
jgi:hypothetical protein